MLGGRRAGAAFPRIRGGTDRYATDLGRVWTELLSASGIARRPFKNLRNSWETNCHWVLRIDPTLIEKMMGHAGHTVTSRHYDRPDEEMFAEAAAKAYAAHPFADTWGI